jgi:hypothetical protein
MIFFGKPVSTFPDHALAEPIWPALRYLHVRFWREAAILAVLPRRLASTVVGFPAAEPVIGLHGA